MPRASCPILKPSDAVKGFVGVPNRRYQSPSVRNKSTNIYHYMVIWVVSNRT